MSMSQKLNIILAAFLTAPLGWTQDAIDLKPADVSRLGIVFAPARVADGASGPRFPATFISSPEGASNVTALYAGIIEAWRRGPGDEVKAGDVLAVIQSPDVLRLHQDHRSAMLALESARFELNKDEKLLAGGMISAQRLNQTRRAHDQAVFAEQAAAEYLRRIGFTAERLRARPGGSGEFGRYDVLAPAAGVLTRRKGAVGDYVEANASVADLRTGGAWIRIQVPARSAAALRVGQELKVSRTNERPVLRQKEFTIDGHSQSVAILAEFTGATDYLPGQVIGVELPPPPGAVLVPGSAVVHSGDETTVFVRTPAGIEARVLPLVPMGSDYLARSGLAAGEELVVQGAALLKGIKAGLGQDE